MGNTSWKKYSFTWKATSGSDPVLSFVNKTGTSTWNDFLLDEISLVKYKAPVIPGAAYANLTLWAKASNLKYPDNSSLSIWNNDDVNGDNLVQTNTGLLPVFKNNAADNFNFNPIVNFSAANSQFIQDDDGFSGSASHTAVTAYVVAKVNTLTQNNKNILIENQANSNAVKVTLNNNGIIAWTAGADPANTVSTPASTIEANKPIVWSFSKDNANTASGNRQDIRKNGVVVASIAATAGNTSSFTGNNSAFSLSNSAQLFDGNIAEVIYLLDSAVTPLRQNKIESYLGVKYGTTLGSALSPVSYTASDGTTIFWPANAVFQNDVFGIGTDSASGLVQKKSNSVNSGSGDGTGQFAKGNLVLSTNTDLADKPF